MPRRKLRHAELPRTAANTRKTVKTTVHGAYGHGIDRVERVIDTVDALHKRRQIDAQQKMAADTFRDAFETVGGRGGGSMDFDKVRAGTPGAPPAPPVLLAAETLRQARAVLGELDGRIVELVVGIGHSIEHAAALVWARPSSATAIANTLANDSETPCRPWRTGGTRRRRARGSGARSPTARVPSPAPRGHGRWKGAWRTRATTG